MPRRDFADAPPDGRVANELDFSELRMCDDRFGHSGGCGAVGHDKVNGTGGEARGLEGLGDEGVGGGAELGSFEHDGAAGSQRVSDSPGAEHDAGVPSRACSSVLLPETERKRPPEEKRMPW